MCTNFYLQFYFVSCGVWGHVQYVLPEMTFTDKRGGGIIVDSVTLVPIIKTEKQNKENEKGISV